jgi:hypothetical protein
LSLQGTQLAALAAHDYGSFSKKICCIECKEYLKYSMGLWVFKATFNNNISSMGLWVFKATFNNNISSTGLWVFFLKMNRNHVPPMLPVVSPARTIPYPVLSSLLFAWYLIFK